MTTPLEAIPAFLAVLQTGSIQGAARELQVARPTLRRRLATLEAHVGVPLLTRGPDLRPTLAGSVFASRAREMIAELEGLSRAARAAGASPHGVLRVGTPAGMPTEMFAQMTDAVRGMWPDVRLELISSTTNDDLIGKVDCRFALELGDPEGPVEIVELGTVCEQLVASKRYLGKHGPITSLKEIADHQLFAWVAPDTGAPTSLPVLDGLDHPVEPAMATNDLSSLVWLANHDHGLAFIPFDAAMTRSPIFNATDLVPVLAGVVARERPRRLVTARAVAGTPVMAAFIELTRTVAEALFADERRSQALAVGAAR